MTVTQNQEDHYTLNTDLEFKSSTQEWTALSPTKLRMAQVFKAKTHFPKGWFLRISEEMVTRCKVTDQGKTWSLLTAN